MDSVIKGIQDRYLDIKLGKVKGWTYGLPRIDKFVGRLEEGQMIMLGGWTGTGKSFFILNMIEGIFKEALENKRDDFVEPKIAVFSTELNTEAYVNRYVCMKAGIYFKQYKESPEVYYGKICKELEDYEADRFANPNSLQIFGNVTSLEQIENALDVIPIKPNIVFIDYIQELSVDKKSDIKDTMPILANRLKNLAIKHKVVLVVVSQINVSALQKNNNPKENNANPFSWGKEMLQATHTALFLNRAMVDGIQEKILGVGILKARDGDRGWFEYAIEGGFKLVPIDK